jgi:hypothetical protein
MGSPSSKAASNMLAHADACYYGCYRTNAAASEAEEDPINIRRGASNGCRLIGGHLLSRD